MLPLLAAQMVATSRSNTTLIESYKSAGLLPSQPLEWAEQILPGRWA
ncbi:hypothetical protein GGR40_004343 [Novosphingobium gossypii]